MRGTRLDSKSYRRTVLASAGRVEVVAETMPAEVEPGWIRLRLAAASVCGTDMHYFRHFANAGFSLQRPTTLGHEACARVVDANGSQFNAGQLVAINPLIACTTCGPCGDGAINMCPEKRFPGSATTIPHIDGFFREYFDFPARCCYPVHDESIPDHVTCTEPLACAIHAVNRAGVREGSRILVTGCGPMGLLATVAARSNGADVDVTDLRPEAIEIAKRLGATRGFVAGDEVIRPEAGAYDVVIEASGSHAAFNEGLTAVRKQGTISMLSLIQRRSATVDLHLVALKEITTVGSILYTAREFIAALELVQSGAIDLSPLITRRVPLRELQSGFDLMVAGRIAGKLVVTP